jgi:hypothetical protein
MGISCERFAIAFLALALPWVVSRKPEPAGGAGVESAAMIPPGTIIPVRLDKPISIKDAKRGQAVEAKVAQMVPLSTGEKIALRATVKGSILSAETDPDGPGVKLTLKFDHLEDHKETMTISTYLRAIASPRAVQSAQMAHSGVDIGTPNGWADTVQIGGDVRFGDGGAVRNRAKQQVGKGVAGGVLVHVSANPAVGCEGPVGSDYPQALWVFSADACGAYDLKGVKVAQTGKSAPAAGFTLHFERDDGKLEAGTAMLLRIAPKPE